MRLITHKLYQLWGSPIYQPPNRYNGSHSYSFTQWYIQVFGCSTHKQEGINREGLFCCWLQTKRNRQSKLYIYIEFLRIVLRLWSFTILPLTRCSALMFCCVIFILRARITKPTDVLNRSKSTERITRNQTRNASAARRASVASLTICERERRGGSTITNRAYNPKQYIHTL